MSINLGSFPVDIHITVGDGTPIRIGTARIPLAATEPTAAQVEVGSSMGAAKSEIAKVLREAADEIENPT